MTGLNKPYAESCDQNRWPILDVIGPLLSSASSVLEIGSGTGQHAVYFGEQLPNLNWYTSDCKEYHPGIHMWVAESTLQNVHAPIELDVTQDNWPDMHVDAVFTANTLHIMSWSAVQALFAGVPTVLNPGGLLIVYGPFNYHGKFTSESNARFEEWLKARDPLSGIRDFEALEALAGNAGLQLVSDYEMPVNNRILCWRKHT